MRKEICTHHTCATGSLYNWPTARYAPSWRSDSWITE